ncbi:MAG: NADPH-dependent assimilatory sulfite reductase hemoprotein subunit [Phycisphaerae bacterium]
MHRPNEEELEQLSKVEHAKHNGRNLRGTIATTLADEQASHFGDDDIQLLKFHGVYQQDDRDERIARKKAGQDKAWQFMTRIGTPGGQCTAEQYLDMDRLAETHANGTLRLTTRQAFQLHGILKGNLKDSLKQIHDALLKTMAACGDIPRNMMAPPACFADEAYQQAAVLAADLSRELAPATGAFHEIWIDGEKHLASDSQTLNENGDVIEREEPFYGSNYLPRKFKIAVALDVDNSTDLWANDCGLLAITEPAPTQQNPAARRTLGYNLYVGGGLGMTHNKPETFARMASPVAYVKPEHAVEAVRGVVALFRDHGNRSERRNARIKYLIDAWGVEAFRAKLAEYVPFELSLPRDVPEPKQLDHLGRHDQGDGRQFYGVWVENGRIKDVENGPAYRTAFREIVQKHRPTVRLTPMQSVLFCDLSPDQVDDVIAVLQKHNVPTVESISNARRYSMACPALPTCGLALADAERIFPAVVEVLEHELERLGLADVELTLRMTGCPNGCARPYNADIGFVGRKPGVYHVFVGGGLAGDRLADLWAADVKIDAVADSLRPLFMQYKQDRKPGENLSDFYNRYVGATERRTKITGKEEPRSVKLAVL